MPCPYAPLGQGWVGLGWPLAEWEGIIYKTTWDTWSETILYLNDSKLVTQNDQGIRYTYNRFKGYLDNVETN